ncbi:MAG: hypothetical protein IKL55_05055 [Clostridia bacterium]|nr:hypothetical protein [Clostridia bacterium]
MRKENGITLINICIIVAIILIVATICAFIFKDSKEKTELNKFISQMELIQEKVNWVRSQYKIWENYNPNETGNFYTYLQSLGYSNANNISNPYIKEFNRIIKNIDESKADDWNSNIDTIIANYCYFSPESLKEILNLENINLHVIINFYTGNVISKTGVKDTGKTIYRQYDSTMGSRLVIPQIYNSDVVPKLEIVENHGLSQKVKISLGQKIKSDIMEVYYYSSKTDETKKMCSKLNGYNYNKEENAVYFIVETSGEYIFIVEDSNFVQYPQIEYQFNLCNEPVLLDGMMGIYWEKNGNETRIVSEYDSNWYNYSKNDFRMANAKTEDGNYWVWVPRFLFKETTESTDIEFATRKTNIATNNKSMSGYTINKAFSEDGEISGFWIAKFQGNVEENSINFKPGKTLTLYSNYRVRNLNTMLKNKKMQLMSDDELNAVLMMSKALEIDISNNLVHYAGGSPEEDGFKNNVQYSSSNNVFGVYDLITSENEITKETRNNEEGRFRMILFTEK